MQTEKTAEKKLDLLETRYRNSERYENVRLRLIIIAIAGQ